jgi:rubredoxin
MALIEIDEGHLCPMCGRRLFYRPMPCRTIFEQMRDSSSAPMAWYCNSCDKYFREEKTDDNNEK